MKIPVEAPKFIKAGDHTGEIQGISYRDTPYKYTDLHILCEGALIKVGYPTAIHEGSKLGQLLIRFGVDLNALVGKEVEIEPMLVGRSCMFQTITEEKEGAKYSRIMPGSVIPFDVVT